MQGNIKDNFFKVMKNKIFSPFRQAFNMTNNMALSGLWKNVMLTKIILTTDDSIGCVKGVTWCQMVWHLVLVQDHIPTNFE